MSIRNPSNSEFQYILDYKLNILSPKKAPKIKIHPIIIDKISLVIDVPNKAIQKDIEKNAQRLKNYIKDKEPEFMDAEYAGDKNIYAYDFRIYPINTIDRKFHENDVPNVYLQIKRKLGLRNGAAYVRVEYNPSKISYDQMTENIGFYINYATNYDIDQFFYNARITKIETAIDIENIDILEFAPSVERGGKSSIYFGSDGQVETMYIGANKSDNQLKIYDKKKEEDETKTKNKGRPAKTASPKVRFEWRRKKISNVYLRDLLDYFVEDNPFRRLDILNLELYGEKLDKYHQKFWELFIDCYHLRKKDAFKRLPQWLKDRMKHYFKSEDVPQINGADLFSKEQWKNELDKHGFIPKRKHFSHAEMYPDAKG